MGRLRDTGIRIGSTLAILAAFVVGVRTLFMRQAQIARARIGKPLGETSPNADRVWQKTHSGSPIRLLMLGDSLAAGLGASHRKQTLGARLAKGVARHFSRPVKLRTAAIVGSESHALADQLDSLPAGYRPDVAVIVIGGNDVTHLIPPESAVKHLERAITRLRELGVPVVVGTCPDLGTLRPVPQPLRSVLSLMSRRMAAVQTRATERAGGVPVSLRRAVGPLFREAPNEMFSVDQFHPSAEGYRRTAKALLPAVVDAVVASGSAIRESQQVSNR